jgi:hypothetical protein
MNAPPKVSEPSELGFTGNGHAGYPTNAKDTKGNGYAFLRIAESAPR